MRAIRRGDPRLCPLCERPMRPGVGPAQARSLRGHGTRVCEACGIEIIEPLPQIDVLLDLYREDYRLHPTSTESRSSASSRVRGAAKTLIFMLHRWRYGRLASDGLQPAGRVLEIGFGSGTRLEALARSGWDSAGLEVAAGPVESLRERIPDGDFRVGSIETSDYPAETFDLVLLYHVLEHLDDPQPALEKIARMVRPDGRLVVALPNRDSLTRRIFRPYWYGYQHPEHLVQYSKRSLESVAAQSGLAVTRSRPQPYFHAVGDSLANIVDPAWTHPMRRRMIKVLAFPVGLVLVLLGDAAAIEIELERAG